MLLKLHVKAFLLAVRSPWVIVVVLHTKLTTYAFCYCKGDKNEILPVNYSLWKRKLCKHAQEACPRVGVTVARNNDAKRNMLVNVWDGGSCRIWRTAPLSPIWYNAIVSSDSFVSLSPLLLKPFPQLVKSVWINRYLKPMSLCFRIKSPLSTFCLSVRYRRNSINRVNPKNREIDLT
jgi:hypothetical protein